MTLHRNQNMLSLRQPAPASPHRHPIQFPGGVGGTGMSCLSATIPLTSNTHPHSINARPPLELSNRHSLQLKFTATHATSTRSLFLIVPNHQLCAPLSTSRTAPLDCGGAPPLCPTTSKARRVPDAPRPALLTTALSNRHTLQLKFTPTHPESAVSLFLIDPNSARCSSTQHKSPETLVAQACPACVRFVFKPKLHSALSNRHTMQLKFALSRPVSTTSLFLIDPKHKHFSPTPEAQ
jgi:hypothetical protein